ncbi:MAG: Slp family lipoprotein [Tahibacter sp.]
MLSPRSCIALLAASLAGCVTAPTPLQGEFSPLLPSTGKQEPDATAHVRWGGEIIRVEPAADRTCFEVLGRELDSQARPRRHDDNAGRFVACRSGFYDPEVFSKGREITVTGVLRGEELRKVGDYDYHYPHVDADVIYLWEKPRPREPYYDAYPWGWGFSPWQGWGYPPVVIIHRSSNGSHHK